MIPSTGPPPCSQIRSAKLFTALIQSIDRLAVTAVFPVLIKSFRQPQFAIEVGTLDCSQRPNKKEMWMHVGSSAGSLAALAEVNRANQAQNTQQLQEGLELLQSAQTQQTRDNASAGSDGSGGSGAAAAGSSTAPGVGDHVDVRA